MTRSPYKALNKAPRQCYKKFDSFVLSISFSRKAFDSCIYFTFDNYCPVYLLLYVDDMLLISKYIDKIVELKARLTVFDIKDMGMVRKYWA